MKPSSERTLQILFVLLIFSVFFPLRHVFDVDSNFVTGAYSDFTSFSLYSCDILLLLIAAYLFATKSLKFSLNSLLLGLLVWLVVIFFGPLPRENGLNIYFFAKILELIVLHETVKSLGWSVARITPLIFSILAALESVLAGLQFILQRSIGFYLLGEQHIGPAILGVAKIGLNMSKFVRGYGTFPHPNLLAAFLLTAAFFNLYLLFSSRGGKERVLYVILQTMIIFGLFISFSRAALLAFVISAAIFFVISFVRLGKKRYVSVSALILILTVVAAGLVFKPFLLARADLTTDQSAKERIFYTKIGLKIIKNNPIIGIGIGTSVLHMQQYSPVVLQPWEIQPIHNYYLLAAAELGIIGALILIALFASYLRDLIKLLRNFSLYHLTLLCILIGFLILMMFDHYFYTIEQTQFLLWMILGLIAAEISQIKKHANL